MRVTPTSAVRHLIVAALIVLGSACSSAPVQVGDTADALLDRLQAVAVPMARAHATLVVAWSGDGDPAWNATWEGVNEELAAETDAVVREFTTGQVTVDALLDPFPFLFEVRSEGQVRCVAPADGGGAGPSSFEVLDGDCAAAGYRAEVLDELVAELSQPALARGRALLEAGYILVEEAAGAADVASALAGFTATTGFEAVAVAPGKVEVYDGALVVCVSLADPAAATTLAADPGVVLDRPRPGPCS